MKTNTKIQIQLESDEQNYLYESMQIIRELTYHISRQNDKIQLCCYDDYNGDCAVYDPEQLAAAVMIMDSISECTEIILERRNEDGE